MGWTNQAKRNTLRIFIAIVMSLPLIHCRQLKEEPPNVDGPVHVTFMHINDLHAYLVPHKDIIRDANNTTKIVERGGLARISTVVQDIRAENSNSVVMNIGDTYHGGVEARFTKGNAMVNPVNSLSVDVGVPGNWDFAFDPRSFYQRYGAMRDANVKRPSFPNLAANLTNTFGGVILPATRLKNYGGTRVGFIGLTSDIVPMMHPALSVGFSFTQGEQKYKDLVEKHARELRAKDAVVVVVMSELGLHKSKRLADIIAPDLVDVVFVGHTHELTEVPITSASGALVVEAGNDGYLGRMDVFVNQRKITNMEWSVVTIDDTIPEDPFMKDLIDKERAPFFSPTINMTEPLGAFSSSPQTLTQPIGTVVGHTNLPLHRRHALQHTFNNAFTDYLRTSAGTDVAITPGFRFGSVVAQEGYIYEDNSVATGDVTVEDVYRFIPVHFTMGLAQSTGIHIRRTLEKALVNAFSHDSFAQNGGWFYGISGLDMQVNLANPDGSKITSMRLKDTGALVTDTTVLSVAGCIRPLEFRNKLCSFSDFSMYVELLNPATGSAYTGTDFLIDMLQNNGPIHALRTDIRDISGLQMWPNNNFYQPIGLVP